MPNYDSALTTLNTNTETNTAIHSSQFDSVRVKAIYRTKKQTHKMGKICLLKINIKLNDYK